MNYTSSKQNLVVSQQKLVPAYKNMFLREKRKTFQVIIKLWQELSAKYCFFRHEYCKVK